MPFFSIIIPIYNSEKYLFECLNSILEQEFDDYEVLMIDDSSTDKSYDICLSYSKKDIRFKSFKNVSKGVASSRNTGIKQANGKYLLFLDSDDYLCENALSLLKASISDEDFIMGSFFTFYEKSHEKLYHETKNLTYTITEFVSDIDFFINNALLQGPCWKAFKTSLIKSESILFPESLSYGEDACFVYSFLAKTKTIKVFNKPLYTYRLRTNTLSHGFNKNKLPINLFLNKLVYDLKALFNVIDLQTFYLSNIASYFMFLNDVGLYRVKKPIATIKEPLMHNKSLIDSFKHYKGSFQGKRKIAFFCAKHKLFFSLFVLSRFNSNYEKKKW